jgi:hypothetical protein
MSVRFSRRDYPWWVKLSMWGMSDRSGLWVLFALSIFAAVCLTIYGFLVDPKFLLGMAFYFPAFWYWLTIRWVDRHGSWEEVASSSYIDGL